MIRISYWVLLGISREKVITNLFLVLFHTVYFLQKNCTYPWYLISSFLRREYFWQTRRELLKVEMRWEMRKIPFDLRIEFSMKFQWNSILEWHQLWMSSVHFTRVPFLHNLLFDVFRVMRDFFPISSGRLVLGCSQIWLSILYETKFESFLYT